MQINPPYLVILGPQRPIKKEIDAVTTGHRIFQPEPITQSNNPPTTVVDLRPIENVSHEISNAHNQGVLYALEKYLNQTVEGISTTLAGVELKTSIPLKAEAAEIPNVVEQASSPQKEKPKPISLVEKTKPNPLREEKRKLSLEA